MLPAAYMTDKITVLRKTVTPDGAGSKTEAWTTWAAYIPARIERKAGQRLVVSESEIYAYNTQVLVNLTGIQEADRLQDQDDNIYRVEAVLPVIGLSKKSHFRVLATLQRSGVDNAVQD